MMSQLPEIPPSISGVILAIVLSLVRSISDKKENSFIKKIVESITCGALTVAAHHAIISCGYDSDWTVFAGGIIGLLGSDVIKTLAMRLVERKTKQE